MPKGRAKIWIFAGLALIAASFLSVPAKADHEGHNTLAAMAIPPYGFIENGSTPRGIIYEILLEVSKRRGGGFVIEIVPIARLIKYMTEGRITCSVFFASDFVKSRFDEIAPIGWDVKSVVYARKNLNLKSYEDLSGATIAVTRGTRFSHKIDNDPQLNRVPTKDYAQSVQMLKAGRVDALVGTDVSIRYLLNKYGVTSGQLSPPLVLNTKSVHLWCAKGMLSPEDKAAFRDTLAGMRNDGTVKSIIYRYLKP